MDPNNHLLAQVKYNLEAPGIDPGSTPLTAAETLISRGIGMLTLIAALYFTLQIILTGYTFFTSEGDEKKAEISRKRLTDNVTGLLLVVVALGVGALLSQILGLGSIFDLNNLKIWAN